jgi:hypothetical protein
MRSEWKMLKLIKILMIYFMLAFINGVFNRDNSSENVVSSKFSS